MSEDATAHDRSEKLTSVVVALHDAGAPGRPKASLLDACRRGDRAAFGRLVEEHQRDVYRLCYRYTGNHDDAADLAQETFLRAWRGIAGFRGDSALGTWLHRIAVNACLNHRASRRPAVQAPLDALPDPSEGAHVGIEREQRRRRVRQAVERLPPRQRATLVLKVFHELTHEQVARALGSSVGTAKANLFHALANLRRALSEEVR